MDTFGEWSMFNAGGRKRVDSTLELSRSYLAPLFFEQAGLFCLLWSILSSKGTEKQGNGVENNKRGRGCARRHEPKFGPEEFALFSSPNFTARVPVAPVE